MFTPLQIFYLSVFLLLNNLVFCRKYVNDYVDNEPLEKSSDAVKGLLTTSCLKHYYRIFFAKAIPPRTYNYYHERPQANDVALSFRIVGGRDVEIENAPYSILYGPYCGGSLIAPEWVLTAAHCEDRYEYVLAGATKTTESDKYPICAHFFHPSWNDSRKKNFHDWDFQLLLLETPVPVTRRSMPIAIGATEDIQPGRFVLVSGWGYTESGAGSMEISLREVMVPIISQDVCLAIPNKYYRMVTPRMFCAGYSNGHMDACQGDSGGPAVLNNRLVGLVSYGLGCAEPGHPGVYTKVPLARPWIRQVTGLPL